MWAGMGGEGARERGAGAKKRTMFFSFLAMHAPARGTHARSHAPPSFSPSAAGGGGYWQANDPCVRCVCVWTEKRTETWGLGGRGSERRRGKKSCSVQPPTACHTQTLQSFSRLTRPLPHTHTPQCTPPPSPPAGDRPPPPPSSAARPSWKRALSLFFERRERMSVLPRSRSLARSARPPPLGRPPSRPPIRALRWHM